MIVHDFKTISSALAVLSQEQHTSMLSIARSYQDINERGKFVTKKVSAIEIYESKTKKIYEFLFAAFQELKKKKKIAENSLQDIMEFRGYLSSKIDRCKNFTRNTRSTKVISS